MKKFFTWKFSKYIFIGSSNLKFKTNYIKNEINV